MFYNVLDYGIIADGYTNNTEKIRGLIEKLHQNGGGTIYFPPGQYVSGSIRLYDHMTLYLDSGATLFGSQCFEDYPRILPQDAPGYERNCYCALITAFNCEDISIIGHGTIDGCGSFWWKALPSDRERPRTINPVLCKNVKIKDITIKNSPCWTVHPLCCENVLIDGITITNPYTSPNTDGINPESCRNVRICNCLVDVGDDCITLKSGTEIDTLQKAFPCENILISNCNLVHGHGGVVIGSEMSGGIKNIVISNCVFQNTDRGIRIKTKRYRGGFIQNVTILNLIMENVMAAITINEYYRCGTSNDNLHLSSFDMQPITSLTPSISDIVINGLMGKNISGAGIYMYGLPEKPIQNIVINNVSLQVVGTNTGVEPIMSFDHRKSYGEGIYLLNTQKIRIENSDIECPQRPITLLHSKDVTINGQKMNVSL